MTKRVIKLENNRAAMPSFTKVAAYARVSTGKDAMLHSLAAQVSYYSKYIQEHPGWNYMGVYADEALTGTKDNRPEFKRLIEDCHSGKIDLVLTKSISRFARNTVDLLETVRELKGLGVDVFFEEQNIHTMTGDGELMLTILASYAQEESLSASENKKWQVRNGYKEGKQSNHFRILGYENSKGVLTVIPEEAKVVRMIYAEYLSGMSKNAIIKKLTKMKIPTKDGGRWSVNGITKILKNEKYVGDMILQKGYVADHLSKLRKRNNGELPRYYVENTHEPLIDRETYYEVQDSIAKRATKTRCKRVGNPSELKGLIQCERCGANFRKKTYGYGTKYRRDTWVCATFITQGKQFCGARLIPENILKEKCAEAIGLSVYDPKVFLKKVKEIRVPDDGELVFIFYDGSSKLIQWEHRSRSESWTEEMKEAARLRAKGRMASVKSEHQGHTCKEE